MDTNDSLNVKEDPKQFSDFFEPPEKLGRKKNKKRKRVTEEADEESEEQD